MKKFAVFLMMFALLLSAACGKQPQIPDVPTEPAPPVTQASTAAPTQAPAQPPTEPVTQPATEAPTQAPTEAPTESVTQPPTVAEPEGFVSGSILQEAVPGLLKAADLVPLEGDIVALHGYEESGVSILIYDQANGTVLSRMAVESYDGTNELKPLADGLHHYDGRFYWKITVGENWQLTREKTDANALYYQMGGHTVSVKDGSILLDGEIVPALQQNDRAAYSFHRVLSDHQLLCYVTDRSIPSMSYFAVYDHAAGEIRAVTTMKQRVIGNWGDLLLVGYNGSNGWYDFGTVSLKDYTYTPLEIGHETEETGVSIRQYAPYDPGYIQGSAENAHLMLMWDKDDTRTVQIVDMESSSELYRWECPRDARYQFLLTGDNSLFVRKELDDNSILWKVEY